MKNKNITLTSFAVIMVILLTACNSGLPAVSKTSANIISGPAGAAVLTSPSNLQSDGTNTNPEFVLAYENALENIYNQVNPSVVNIRVVQMQTVQSDLTQQFPFNLPGSPNSQAPTYSESLGSGFVWDMEGHIVTNNHVVDGADKIEVKFSDGTTVPAELVGNDADSDLAVIKVNVASDQLHPVQIADSNQIKVGQLAIALGNPFGLENTMTVGIVSALGRTIPAGESNSVGPSYSIPDIIQTDAPINPGNSGGVLVNDEGQVIGITSAIESPVSANAGIGFAIPSAIVEKVAPVLIKSGHYVHPFLGISGTTLTPELATAMELTSDQRGALVVDVTSGGPAEKAGLHGSNQQVTIDGQDYPIGGDVITAADGTAIKTMDDLIAYLSSQTDVGQKVSLTVLRNGKEMSLDVTLEARPADIASASSSSSQVMSNVWLGVSGVSVTPEIATTMDLPENQQGLLVGYVEIGSPADKAGLRGSDKSVDINGQRTLIGGDIITAIDGNAVTSLDDLRGYLQNANPDQQVRLTILRDGKTIQVEATLTASPTGM